jgi:hypothetical protein
MTSLITEPQLLKRAAKNVAELGSEIGEAKAAAAGPTTGVAAAAADEVSAATAKLFGGYAQEYQAVLAQAAAFHDRSAAVSSMLGTKCHSFTVVDVPPFRRGIDRHCLHGISRPHHRLGGTPRLVAVDEDLKWPKGHSSRLALLRGTSLSRGELALRVTRCPRGIICASR